jgi:hypothetical protein
MTTKRDLLILAQTLCKEPKVKSYLTCVLAGIDAGTLQRLAHGPTFPAKKPGVCALSRKPIKVGDMIVWDRRSGLVAHKDEAVTYLRQIKLDDDDMRMMGY